MPGCRSLATFRASSTKISACSGERADQARNLDRHDCAATRDRIPSTPGRIRPCRPVHPSGSVRDGRKRCRIGFLLSIVVGSIAVRQPRHRLEGLDPPLEFVKQFGMLSAKLLRGNVLALLPEVFPAINQFLSGIGASFWAHRPSVVHGHSGRLPASFHGAHVNASTQAASSRKTSVPKQVENFTFLFGQIAPLASWKTSIVRASWAPPVGRLPAR